MEIISNKNNSIAFHRPRMNRFAFSHSLSFDFNFTDFLLHTHST